MEKKIIQARIRDKVVGGFKTPSPFFFCQVKTLKKNYIEI